MNRPSAMKTSPSATPRHALAAFTLIELLTVIAIIGILAAILIPTIGKVKESAAKTACVSNLHQIAVATLTYASEHKGLLPPHDGVYPFPHSMRSQNDDPTKPSEWDQFKPYLGDVTKAEVMYCPGALNEWRGPTNPNNEEYWPDRNYITYAYYGHIALTASAQTAFGITGQGPLKNSKTIPTDVGLWTCLTYRNGGRYHGHSDPDTAQMVQGQNAAHLDGSVRWVKGADLIPYVTSDSTFYGPRPRG